LKLFLHLVRKEHKILSFFKNTSGDTHKRIRDWVFKELVTQFKLLQCYLKMGYHQEELILKYILLHLLTILLYKLCFKHLFRFFIYFLSQIFFQDHHNLLNTHNFISKYSKFYLNLFHLLFQQAFWNYYN
jgi:hypothetical protein